MFYFLTYTGMAALLVMCPDYFISSYGYYMYNLALIGQAVFEKLCFISMCK